GRDTLASYPAELHSSFKDVGAGNRVMLTRGRPDDASLLDLIEHGGSRIHGDFVVANVRHWPAACKQAEYCGCGNADCSRGKSVDRATHARWPAGFAGILDESKLHADGTPCEIWRQGIPNRQEMAEVFKSGVQHSYEFTYANG